MPATDPPVPDGTPVSLLSVAQAFALQVVTGTPFGDQPEAFLLLLAPDGRLRKVPTEEYTRAPGGSLPAGEPLLACARVRIHPAAPRSWDRTICDRWHPEALVTTCEATLREAAVAADIVRHQDSYALSGWQEVDPAELEGWETALPMILDGSFCTHP